MMARLRSLFHDLWWRLRVTWFRSQLEAEIEDELHLHTEMDAAELRRKGLSRAEATMRAGQRFGSAARVRDECLDAAGAPFRPS